jgi:hypothetical protein
LQDRRLTIPDLGALQMVGKFNSAYLHHHRNARHTDETREGSDAVRASVVPATVATQQAS